MDNMKEYKEIDKTRGLRVKRKNSRWVELGVLVLIGLEVYEKFGPSIKVFVNGFVQ